jgi:hypothetical protein
MSGVDIFAIAERAEESRVRRIIRNWHDGNTAAHSNALLQLLRRLHCVHSLVAIVAEPFGI